VRFAFLFCAVASFSLPFAAETPPASCQAEVFVLQTLERTPVVGSPDGHYRVTLFGNEEKADGILRVFRSGEPIREFPLRHLSGGIFVKWAPDSRAFYFMWSDGGVIGNYSVRVFQVAGNTVNEVPATEQAARDFARSHYCKARGNNMFAIRWLNGSNTLLVATQVYPTGDCGKDLGLFGGYEVRIDDGLIVRSYTEKQLKSLWPDGCPSRIWPTGLWGDAELQRAKQELKDKKQVH